ncbi:hypothetical protein [Polaromonas sp.]|uniref:hypothetical protein n=1 Tax=Polaromonas sp. TaxID=1869339 RepID=UPI003BABF7D9
MPYVQRNFIGEMTGIYANSQEGYAEEFLPDDHPEIQDFQRRYPIPDARPLTLDVLQRIEVENKKANENIQALGKLTLEFLNAWSTLEMSLGSLFAATLNHPQTVSRVASAVYYGLTGFEARIGATGSAIVQLADDLPELAEIIPAWMILQAALREIKKTRNHVAHGSITRIHFDGKQYVGITSPSFDPRIGRYLKAGSDPGLTAIQLRERINEIHPIYNALDKLNTMVSEYKRFGKETLPGTRVQLDSFLNHLKPQSTDSQNPSAPSPQLSASLVKRVLRHMENTKRKALAQRAMRGTSQKNENKP